MRVIAGFTFGIILTLVTITQLIPQADTQHHVQVITRTVTEYEQLDLNAHRDVSAVSQHDDDILAECAYAIARQTDEPIAGIVIYVDRYWEGDTCAAYLHLVDHGWY
jgi:hypothetical protein